MHPYLQSLLGGLLIGVAVFIMARGLGRVTGISGITANAIAAPFSGAWRWAFLAGLVIGGVLIGWLLNLSSTAIAPTSIVAVAGLAVGVGTVLGSGCTSGHGVCGIARLSMRSIVATLVFMGAGIVTVAVVRLTSGGVL